MSLLIDPETFSSAFHCIELSLTVDVQTGYAWMNRDCESGATSLKTMTIDTPDFTTPESYFRATKSLAVICL
mgnify:CR=1 FL=1